MAQGKYFYMRSLMTGLVLEVSGQHAGAPVCMAPQLAREQDQQLWYRDLSSDSLRSKLHDYCLDINVETGEACVRPYQSDNPRQRWQLQAFAITNLATFRVLDVVDGNPYPGARVTAWMAHGGLNQQWTFEHVAAKFFLIKSKMNDKVMEVKGWVQGQVPEPGTKVAMNKEAKPAMNSQMWYEDTSGVVRCKLADYALDSSDGKTMRVHPYNSEEAAHQWICSGDRIINRSDSSKCLDIKGKNKSNGAELCPYQYKGQSNQKWQYVFI